MESLSGDRVAHWRGGGSVDVVWLSESYGGSVGVRWFICGAGLSSVAVVHWWCGCSVEVLKIFGP